MKNPDFFFFLTPYFPVFNKCKYCCSSSSFNDGGAAASGKGSTGSKCTFWILFHVILHYRVIYVTQTSTPKKLQSILESSRPEGPRSPNLMFPFFGNCVKPDARYLKSTEKVAFNIASEASYVYILSGQKVIKMPKIVNFG